MSEGPQERVGPAGIPVYFYLRLSGSSHDTTPVVTAAGEQETSRGGACGFPKKCSR